MISARSHRSSFQIRAATNERWRDFDMMLFLTMLVLMGFGTITIWSAIGLPSPLTLNGSLQLLLLELSSFLGVSPTSPEHT